MSNPLDYARSLLADYSLEVIPNVGWGNRYSVAAQAIDALSDVLDLCEEPGPYGLISSEDTVNAIKAAFE